MGTCVRWGKTAPTIHTSRGDGFPAGSLANSHHGAFAKTCISAPPWRLRCASLTQKTQSFWGKTCCPGGSCAEWIPEATRGRQETAPRNDFFAFFFQKKRPPTSGGLIEIQRKHRKNVQKVWPIFPFFLAFFCDPDRLEMEYFPFGRIGFPRRGQHALGANRPPTL